MFTCSTGCIFSVLIILIHRSQRRDQRIAELRANIDRGQNVEPSERVLHAILRENAGYHFVQSPEDGRVQELQLVKDTPEYTEQDKINLDAVVRDYRNGSLPCPPPGTCVVYFGGQRKTPAPVEILDYPVMENVDQWLPEGATGRIWLQQVSCLDRLRSWLVH